MANFHFAWAGTDYLAAGLPPSPLQNFWTLSVEEQFYVVFPTIFLVIAGLRLRPTSSSDSGRACWLFSRPSLSVCSLPSGPSWQTNSNPRLTPLFPPFSRACGGAVGSHVGGPGCPPCCARSLRVWPPRRHGSGSVAIVLAGVRL